MRTRGEFPCTFQLACHVLWAIKVMGWSQTRAALEIGLSQGTVNHIVHRRRFSDAYPIPLPGWE
jgi:hypothetical protein